MPILLGSVKKSGAPKPPIVMAYSVHGIGKTTFGACAPDPIFIQTEDGLGMIETNTFGFLKTYDEVIEAIGVLCTEDHDYKTVVLDSTDWLEPMVWAETARANGWKSIDDGSKSTAYGKGFAAAVEVWKFILDGLKTLRDERNMGVILLAHSEIKRHEAPDTEPYDRYQPKLQKGASAVIQEACDAVLFFNYRVQTVKSDASGFDKKTTRGVGIGERLLYTVERPAFLAKNRWSLPDSMPLSWDAFAAGIPYYNQSTQPEIKE